MLALRTLISIWAAVAFLVWIAAAAPDNVTHTTTGVSYGTEATIAGSNVGFWAVYSTEVLELEKSTRPQGDHPCCLMVKMKMVVMCGDEVLDQVPERAVNANDTCSTYGEGEQELRLSWKSDSSALTFNSSSSGLKDESAEEEDITDDEEATEEDDDDDDDVEDDDSHLTMTLSMMPDSNPRIPYPEDDVWIWMSRLHFETPSWRIKLKGVKLFEAPRLFAFTCKGQTISVPAVARRLDLGSSGRPAGQDGQGSDMVNVTLVFHHLEVEGFRDHRFYAEFTHMKWKCHYGWSHGHVPAVVNVVLVAFTLFIAVHFAMRHRNWKQRNGLVPLTDENDNLSSYQADDEQQVISSADD